MTQKLSSDDKYKKSTDLIAQLHHRIQDLEAERRRFNTLLAVIPDIIYEIDYEGKFTYINEAISILGYCAEDLIGQHFSMILHPDDLKKVSRDHVLPRFVGIATGQNNSPKLFDERRTGNRGTRNLALQLIPKNWRPPVEGQPKAALQVVYGEVVANGKYSTEVLKKEKKFLGTVGAIRSVSVARADGIPYAETAEAPSEDRSAHSGTVGIIRDVTERRRYEDQRIHLEEQLRHSQKLEAIGQLAGGIAHDFNNILAAISGYAEIISHKFAGENPQLKHYTSVILSATKRAADLTVKLLSFARRGSMKHITFDMHQLVADIMVLLSHSIGKSIVVDKKLEADLATIVGDRSQIEEAMLNIAINSRDAMPAGGAITFVTKNVTPSQEFLFAHGYTGMTESFLLVSISDTGFGMDSATLSRVCEPFFTTKGLGKGTGLGMASVYGTIKVHGGIIDIQSTKDIGTIVSIYFPIGSSASTAPAPLPPPPVEKKTRGTLLVIDDEHFVRDICKELLEGSGYKVSTCSSGFEALAYYQLHHTEIQLVIIDMIMPQMNGFQTLAEFKKINPSVKAILSTGYHLEDATRKVLDAGFMRIINKPFSAQDLDKAVSDAMAVLTVNK